MCRTHIYTQDQIVNGNRIKVDCMRKFYGLFLHICIDTTFLSVVIFLCFFSSFSFSLHMNCLLLSTWCHFKPQQQQNRTNRQTKPGFRLSEVSRKWDEQKKKIRKKCKIIKTTIEKPIKEKSKENMTLWLWYYVYIVFHSKLEIQLRIVNRDNISIYWSFDRTHTLTHTDLSQRERERENGDFYILLIENHFSLLTLHLKAKTSALKLIWIASFYFKWN